MNNTPRKISDGEWAENDPLVSICGITYNHEKYIRDCLDGFLMQETTFPVEIIINDDASTDKTADMIREYAKKYPDIFITILQNENKYSKGIKPIFEYVYPKARENHISAKKRFWSATHLKYLRLYLGKVIWIILALIFTSIDFQMEMSHFCGPYRVRPLVYY